jgi:hypothetical protein
VPVLIALVAIVVSVVFFVIRARNAAHLADELVDVANDVRLAARRFGFRRTTNVHPVESIDDVNLATGALAAAFLELDDLPTKDQRDRFNVQLRNTLELDARTAQETEVLGRWFISECGGAQPAVTRLSRKLFKLGGAPAMQPVLTIIQGVMQGSDSGLSQRQNEALVEMKNAFRIQ